MKPVKHASCGTFVKLSEDNAGRVSIICPHCLVRIADARELAPRGTGFRADPRRGAQFDHVQA